MPMLWPGFPLDLLQKKPFWSFLFVLVLASIQNICPCSALCISNPEVPLFPLVLLFIVYSLRKSSNLIDIALAKNLLFLNTKQDVEIW